MDARQFLGLEPTRDPTRWRMPVVQGLCTGGGFLFGGAGLAAAVAALEGTTGRPVVWAAAQYLSFARPGTMLDVDVTVAVEGHQVSQARAVATVDGDEILTVNAALGRRPFEAVGEWAIRPDAPPPDECRPRAWRHEHADSIQRRVDARMASGRDPDELDGTPGDGRTLMWARVPEITEVSAGMLAVLGDYVPSGIGQALGARAGGRSLDNTIRVVQLVPTEWVLLDIRVQAVANGFGHGLVHQWAEDGTLLATASQSAIVKFWKD
jgi:acyl-CoA thioesterase II